MKCLVTGAAGFIGSSLCDELLRRGSEVVGIDAFIPYYPRRIKESNLLTARDHRAFQFVEGDLVDVDLAALLDGIEVVFHLAAQAGVRSSWERDFDIYVRDNVLATQRLLEACRLAKPRRLVYASSSSIYGNAPMLPVIEDTCGRPVSPYGVTKLAAEHLCDLYWEAFGIPTVSVRYFTVYGPRQRPDMAFHRFIRGAITREPITIYGDGSQSRDFTYVADAVAATIAAASHGQPGRKYNIGGGAIWTVRDILGAIAKLVGLELDVRHLGASPGDVRDTAANTTRAHEELSYSPATDVELGLAQEMHWIRNSLESGVLELRAAEQ